MMKRRGLMKRLKHIAKDQGVEMETTEGASHTKVEIGDNATVVPRHKEINEHTARAIIDQAEGKK